MMWGGLRLPLSTIGVLGFLCLIVGAEVLRGPSEVTVRDGEKLSVTCHYNDGYQSYVKYWCKGSYWKSCDIIIRTSDGNSRRQGRYSIDEHYLRFIVTIDKIRPEDSDTYHCGIEKTFNDYMHPVRVTVLPGVCRETPSWTSIVDFPPGFSTIEENKDVEVSCKKPYEKKTFSLRCVKKSDVFQFYPHPEAAPCTRKCSRMMDWGQNISMYPEKEYYDRDEEVTLMCPAGYRPNHSKIQCIRDNGTNVWNVMEVFCTYSPGISPGFLNHTSSRRHVGASCCLGVIPPMVVKLITVLVILIVRFSNPIKRRPSSAEERSRHREPDLTTMKSRQRAKTNVYRQVKEDPKIREDTEEEEPEMIYMNVEVDPSCNIYTSTC